MLSKTAAICYQNNALRVDVCVCGGVGEAEHYSPRNLLRYTAWTLPCSANGEYQTALTVYELNNLGRRTIRTELSETAELVGPMV